MSTKVSSFLLFYLIYCFFVYSLFQIEFVVKMTCNSCVKKVDDMLKNREGIVDYKIDLESNVVIVDTVLPASEVFSIIDSTGLKTALRGYGGKLL